MKLAANLSMLFTELPLLERIHAAAQAGFSGVEIQFPYEVPALELQAALRQAQMPLVLINIPAGNLMTGGLGIAAHAERQQAFDQALKQALAYAACVRPSKVNLLAGRTAPEADREQAFQTLARNARKAAVAFAELGIQVLCEAINPLDMPGFVVNSPDDLARLCALVDHPNCAAQLDIYHLERQGFTPESLQVLTGKIAHVQFADCLGRAEPGTGQVDFSAWLAVLKAQGYDAWLSAEYKPSRATELSLGWLPRWQQQLA